MDLHRLAGCSDRIFCPDAANSERFCKYILAYHWNKHTDRHLAEKSLEQESVPWRSSRIYPLVLERAVDLAKSAPEYSVRCHRKYCMFDRYLFWIEIFVERGI